MLEFQFSDVLTTACTNKLRGVTWELHKNLYELFIFQILINNIGFRDDGNNISDQLLIFFPRQIIPPLCLSLPFPIWYLNMAYYVQWSC